VATDYDEARSDLKEAQDSSLEALQSASAPDALSVIRELDDADTMDDATAPGWEFVAEELIVEIVPQAEDVFTCYSCFLVGTAPPSSAKRRPLFCLECEGCQFAVERRTRSGPKERPGSGCRRPHAAEANESYRAHQI
jgi:hypothetical protein